MLNKEEENKDKVKWISVAQVKLEQELYNQMHNEWIHKNGCGKEDCLICNSIKK